MLDEAKIPYEHRSSFPELASVCGAFGCTEGDTFAPVVVVDGDESVSQSVAACMFVAKKCGFTPPGGDGAEAKALQYMLDIVDLFEGGLAGSKDKGGAALKAFLEGDRFPKQAGNVERAIAGPFFFGDAPSSVDFFLCAQVDWHEAVLLERLAKDKGVADPLAPYAKLRGVVEGIRGLASYRASGLATTRDDFKVKDEVIAAYL